MLWIRRWGLTVTSLSLCVLLGLVTGLGLFTFRYAEGASYFSTDPAACMNCHVMRDHFDSWLKSSHHAHATCIDCHLPHEFVPKYIAKAENGWNHSLAFTLQNFPEPIRIHRKNSGILQDACIRCHQGLVSDLVGHGAFADDSNSCVRCHSQVGHGSTR